jgi:hypothetical protein
LPSDWIFTIDPSANGAVSADATEAVLLSALSPCEGKQAAMATAHKDTANARYPIPIVFISFTVERGFFSRSQSIAEQAPGGAFIVKRRSAPV